MTARRLAVASALALCTLAAGTAAAQDKNAAKGGADQCKLDFGGNDQVRTAYNNITLLQLGTPKPEEAKKRLKTAVGALTSRSDFGKDQLARDFALGQALVEWYQLPGESPVASRGDVGYGSNPTGTVDLLAAADSAFTAVEKAKPECADKTSVYRKQPWARLVNQVGPLLNGEKADSAAATLSRAMTIYRDSPFNYYFQGQLAQRKGDWQTASDAYARAAALATPEEAAKDSNVASIREFASFSAAYGALKAAQAQSGDQQRAGMQKAAALYRAYLKEYPSGPNAQPAQAGLTVALKASGDTASLASMWTDMIANPARYSDTQLYDAGTQAFSADKIPTSVQLLELGEKANPYLRAGLFNLANAYWKNNQFDKMLEVSRRLTKLDPDNPDNYQLIAIAYQQLAKAEKDPKTKKVLTDSVGVYVTASDKLPVHVSFSEFTHDGPAYTLAGSVENLTSAAKSVSLVVSFLDKSGQVVTTQTAPLSLGSKETKKFTLTANDARIVAFRYDPVK